MFEDIVGQPAFNNIGKRRKSGAKKATIQINIQNLFAVVPV